MVSAMISEMTSQADERMTNTVPQEESPVPREDTAPREDTVSREDAVPSEDAVVPPEGSPGPRPGSALTRLCATVLSMETIVIWLAIPVALAVDHASPQRAGSAGVTLAVAAVVLAVLARRRLRWTLVGGSVLQVVVIAAGVIVPVMYFLGAIFAAFWVIGIVLGRRWDAASQLLGAAS
jgi:hypothetical protein